MNANPFLLGRYEMMILREMRNSKIDSDDTTKSKSEETNKEEVKS